MHLLVISLLAILAGTLLLAKTRKDELGKFFAFVSWFFIVVGFILFIGFCAGGICKMSNGCMSGQSDCRQEMMMKELGHGMHDGICCPPGKCKAMCEKKESCIKQDSIMKGCPKHPVVDSCKMRHQNQKLPGNTQ